MICMGKLVSKAIRLHQFLLIKKKNEVNKKIKNSIEQIINSGNCIYDYAHSFFGKDFQSNALHWYYFGRLSRIYLNAGTLNLYIVLLFW